MYQIQILLAITPEKLEKASLVELLRGFALLLKLEKKTEGKDKSKIYNLFDHLLWVDKFEKHCANCPNNPTKQ